MFEFSVIPSYESVIDAYGIWDTDDLFALPWASAAVNSPIWSREEAIVHVLAESLNFLQQRDRPGSLDAREAHNYGLEIETQYRSQVRKVGGVRAGNYKLSADGTERIEIFNGSQWTAFKILGNTIGPARLVPNENDDRYR